MTIHIERGGDTGPTVLLLHGSGATGAVWGPVVELLDGVRWIVVDLPGHGRSSWLPSYHHDDYATALASALDTAKTDLVVGHSLGGLVGLTLAGRVPVGAVTVLSMKVAWTPEQLAGRTRLADRPQRTFPDRADALRLFAKVSGLPVDSAGLASGIRETPEGYCLAADPHLTADPPASPDELATVMSRVTVPVQLACGDADPGIDPADMTAVLGRAVTVLSGAGHNPHIDVPARVADLITTAARG